MRVCAYDDIDMGLTHEHCFPFVLSVDSNFWNCVWSSRLRNHQLISSWEIMNPLQKETIMNIPTYTGEIP